MNNFKDFIIRITHSETYRNIANITSKLCFLLLIVSLITILFEEQFSKILAPFVFFILLTMFLIDFLNIFRFQSKEVIVKNSLLMILLANKDSWFWLFFITSFIVYCFFPNIFNYVICTIIFVTLIIFGDKISEFFYKKLIQ